MKEFKGTPGPWSLDEFDNVVHGNADSWGRKELVKVSGVALPGRVTEEYAANTRLVSAAPDLLEALQEVTGSLGVMVSDADNCPEILKARAAISKALGEE